MICSSQLIQLLTRASPPKRNRKASAMASAITIRISVPCAQFFRWMFPSLKAHTSTMMNPIMGRPEMKMVNAHSLASSVRLFVGSSIFLIVEFKGQQDGQVI